MEIFSGGKDVCALFQWGLIPSAKILVLFFLADDIMLPPVSSRSVHPGLPPFLPCASQIAPVREQQHARSFLVH